MNRDEIFSVPHSEQAEQAVLGGLLLDNDAVDRMGDLEAGHFYAHGHRTIFTAITSMIVAGKPADVLTTFEALERSGKLEEVGGLPYLNSLAQNTPSAANIHRYAQLVRDRAVERALLVATQQLGELAFSDLTIDEKLDKAQSIIAGVAERKSPTDPKMLGDLLPGLLESLERRAEGNDRAIATGFAPVDRVLNGGFRRGNLVIVAGRPSMGKSALGADMGLNMAEAGYGVLLWTGEMSAEECVARAIANRGKASLPQIMGQIQDATWPHITHGLEVSQNLAFAVDETAAITLLQLRMKAKTHKRKHGLDVLIVDYLGLMSGGDGDKRYEQIGYYSRGLKALAKELGIVVIALAQLNRKSEERSDKKPVLSDLRDSGEIEQDADTVILCHRPEMHDPNNEQLKGLAEILIRKQRNGPLADILMRYRGDIVRFFEWEGRAPTIEPRGRGFGG